jgi:para-nitrobenzyl esterase
MSDSSVLTPSGPLTGMLSKSGRLFKGIPYAKPPLESLRFRAPLPVKWHRTLDASKFRPAPMQALNAFTPVGETSEDCLYLNIWSPTTTSEHPKPVMVWIHGGSFLSGAGSMPMYHGERLSDSGDVIVVTINYRLGAFGFVHWSTLDHKIEADANLGLRDILASLQWVRNNIEAFGGDPENITLFGESAGAIAIACLLASPLRVGLFQRAIIQSGTPDQVISPTAARSVCRTLIQELGLDKGSLHKLWTLPAQEILAAQKICQKMSVPRGEHPVPLPLFEATMSPMFGDEVLPQVPLQSLAQGAAKDLDIIAGTMLNEWDMFLHLKRGRFFATQNSKYQQLDQAGVLKLFQRGLPDHAQDALTLYQSTRQYEPSGAGLLAVYSDFESDRTFCIPTLRMAEAQAQHERPIYHYEITWDAGLLGAAHGSDIPLTFGDTDSAYAQMMCGKTPRVSQLSHEIQRAWCQFAATGIPNLGTGQDWPCYTLHNRATLQLGQTNQIVHDRKTEELSFWAPYF